MTGYELKQRRERLGLSQQDLALSLNGLAVSTVARWEQLKEKEIDNKLLEIAMETLEQKEMKEQNKIGLINFEIEIKSEEMEEFEKTLSKFLDDVSVGSQRSPFPLETDNGFFYQIIFGYFQQPEFVAELKDKIENEFGYKLRNWGTILAKDLPNYLPSIKP